MRPILSICIPTYCRASLLRNTLDSLVNQSIFQDTSLVEIIVSDNASTDNTSEVCQDYVERFPGRVRYFRNSENVGDRNFVLVMDAAYGEFIKLNNDTLTWFPGTLEKVVGAIRSEAESKPSIYFTNGNIKTLRAKITCHGLDETVRKLSYWVNWIGGFGIWRADYETLQDPLRAQRLQLIQTDIFFRTVARRGSALLVTGRFFEVQNVPGKGGYNLFEVFAKNYLGLVSQFVKGGLITERTFRIERWRLFWRFLVPWVYRIQTQRGFTFGIDNWNIHNVYYRGGAYRHILFSFSWLAKVKRGLKILLLRR